MIIIGTLFLAAAGSLLLKDRIENYIGASIILTTFMTYFFAILGFLEVGLYISITLCFAACVIVIYISVRDKGERLKLILTPGLLAFAVISFGLFVLNMNTDASGSPDSLYWVQIAKGIYYYDDFWKGYTTQTHPQFIAIWGYLSMKTWPHWSDMVLVASNNIYKISLLLPLFAFLPVELNDCDKKSELYKNLFLSIIIAIFPYVSDSNEFSIYSTDLIMGILLGMGVVFFSRALSEKNNRFYYIALVYFCAATETKRIAIVILAMIMVWLFYFLLSDNNITLVVFYLVAPALAYFIGAGSIKYALTMGGALMAALVLRVLVAKKSVLLNVFAVTVFVIVSSAGIWYALKKAVEEYTSFDQLDVAKAYVRMLFTANGELYYVGEMVHLSIMAFLLVVIVLFLWLKHRNKDSIRENETLLFVGMLITVLLYLTLMCYLYITKIANASGQYFRDSLLGLSRYMKIIPMMLGCYLLYIVISNYKESRAILLLLLCVSMFCNLLRFSEFIFLKEEKIIFPELELAGVNLADEDNVAYIDMGVRNYYRSFILYCFPHHVTNIDELSYTYRVANDMKYVSQEELHTLLEGCNYLYIKNADSEFPNRYKELFANESEIKTERAFYSIDENTGSANLIYSN